ncbi:MAG: WYL domain-containing protein [Phenylobacterium sp.]|nr:WYL domain-containing protein [Phenylobacterium sp.]
MSVRVRQDAIVRCLRRRGSMTVGTLADEVGVSRRTVLRDVRSLRDQGFVIGSEPGRGGGLRLDPLSVQTTAKLTVTEAFALLISVASMRAAGNLPFSGYADAGLAKIERALPPETVRDLRRLLDSLHIGQVSPHQDLSGVGAINPDLLPAFETAFLGRSRLSFEYCDAGGRLTRRDVEPQALLILPPIWYLVGWDPTRDGFRHFRMDRIRAPEPVEGAKFRPRRVPFDEDVCPYRDWPPGPGADSALH